MNKIYILLLFWLCSNVLIAQIITIKDSNGQALEMATLVSKQPMVYAVTNHIGQADISAFKNSKQIEIRMLGYHTVVKSFADFEKSLFIITLQPAGLRMDEVVVTAAKWNQAADEIPTKITQISNKTVSLLNPQTAADLLGVSNEVFIQKSQQGGGSPMIRGFATNRLLYVVDGVRMNTAIFRSGNIQNVISLDPLAIENTEVLFGPGSVIYGSDAIGGVMNFQTLTPQFSLNEQLLTSGKALSRYSSANQEKTLHFDVNVGWKKFSTLTSITYSDFGDLKMGTYGPDSYLRPFYVQRQDSVDVVVQNKDTRIQTPTAYSQINLMQKFRFKPSKNWDINYGFHYSETSEYARYDRHIRYKNGLPRYGEWSYGPQKWMMNQLAVSHSGRNSWYDQMNLNLAIQQFDESRMDRNFNKPDRFVRIEQVDAYSANLDFVKSIGARHQLMYGAEAVLNHVKSTGIDENIATGVAVAGPSRYPQSDWSSYGLYLTDRWSLTEKLVLTSGIRYTQYLLNAIFDTSVYQFPFTSTALNQGALTGQIGLTFKPNTTWVISGNLSTGFRSPNVDDLGKVFDSGDGAVTVPNPDLKAEYAYNAELGVAKIFAETIKIDATAYYTLLQDAMVRRNYTLNGQDSIVYEGELSQVQAIQNAAETMVYGIQLSLEVKLPVGFSFETHYNFQKGEEELDNGDRSPSRHAAPQFGSLQLNYKAERISMQLYALFSGEKQFEDLPFEEQSKTEIYAIDSDGNPWSPAWYTLNFKAQYQFEKFLTVVAGIENITDQRYRPYSSGIVAAGRNLVMSVKASF